MTTAAPPLADVTALLERLAGDPPRHARFLNTLSLLEYIGVRKILKSQREETISAELLEHILEEARHAFVLKTLAQAVGGGAVPTYGPAHLLAGAEARRYIQTIDRGAEADLAAVPAGAPGSGAAARVHANYLYTTILIEERANAVYPLHEPNLARLGHGGVLAGIIREERGHLDAVTRALERDDPRVAPRLERLRAVERAAFRDLLAALAAAAA